MCRHVLLVLLGFTLVLLPGVQTCPRSCNCYQANEVHCTFRSLLTVPPGLPAHTRRINFGFNSISQLHDGSLAGLKKAELLMLHSNDLQHLPDGVFRDMKSLQILKLSYNKLREIPSPLTFSGLTSLLRLYLDHNLLQHIHPRALLQLPSLRLLRLQGNRLHQLHPHALCTLSLLNTYYFSTLRHLDLSNNSLSTLHRETLTTAPLLETLVLQANPWSCDCRMNWFLSWTLAHPGLMKCPGGPHCPVCASPHSLQGRSLLEQTALLCTSPVIASPGKETPLGTELSEIQSSESFREPLGSASLSLFDQQGNSVDLNCNITHSSDSQSITPPPDLSQSSSSPLPLALSLSLDCPVGRQSYEKLWRILAYYSETAVRLEREIMLSKTPALAYRYRQAGETDGYYHTGVRASVKAVPEWLLQPAVSIQLNRAQSNGQKVQLIYSTRVSAHPDSPGSHPWVMVATNHCTTAMAAAPGSNIELISPLLSSGKPKVLWILPDGSKLTCPSSSSDGRHLASDSGLRLQKVQLSDAGIYYYVASAGRDVDVLAIRLAVEESSVPFLGEQVGPTVMGSVGEPVSLSCRVSGSPEPSTSWILPDGNVVRHGLAVSGGLTIESNGRLSLTNPSLSDAGYYRCIAVNQYGSDSLSMQLNLNSQHIPSLRTSFPREPQSAAGRSTKIRAPLLHHVDEGSGAGEEEEAEKSYHGTRKRPTYPANRHYLNRKPQRRGPVREGPPRRGGGPVSPTRNRFENRHRITTNKQRIDPQKWADLLAKIRQKTAQTSTSQPTTTGSPTTEPIQENKVDLRGNERDDDTERGGGAETEGSSVDDAVLKEEGLQHVQPVHTATEADGSTENETEKTGTVTQKEPITSNQTSRTNEIVPEPSEGEDRVTNHDTSTIRPQNSRQGLFPNFVPNSRPQSPWNARRTIGQRRRIINRPRGRPLTPPKPLPDPMNHRSQTTSNATTNQIRTSGLVSTATPPAGDHIKMNPTSPPVSSSSSTSEAASHPKTNTDVTTQEGRTLDTEDPTHFHTSTPTPHPDTVISETHVQNTHTGTFTHGTQTHTDTQKAAGQHTGRQPGSEGLERNILGVPNESSTVSVSVVATTTSAKITSPSTSTTSTTLITEDTLQRTTAMFPTRPTMTFIIPTSTSTISTATLPSTSSTTGNSTTTTLPLTHTATDTSIATSSTTISLNDIQRTSNPISKTTSTVPTTTKTTTTAKIPSTTKSSSSTTTTTTTASTNTTPSSKGNLSVSRTDPRGVPPNPSRPTIDWKNSGANSIPDSHSSRSNWSPFLSLPDAPGAPVVRSRPKISDPHIRTVSVPAESTARLDCEAQGEPRPSITWTKVATGVVMSIHSRAQRSEVLPNGTLVIQDVQLQDRGTYICSAQSFLGRDRLLTTLEVWTRPPRMQLASYRESTIHQGGELRLECQANGVPSPLLSWVLPDRSVLTSTGNAASRIGVDANGTLHISVTLPSDRGVYRCVASNSAGAASASVRVHVSSLPPVIQQPRDEYLLLSLGRPVYAHCSARGAPLPTLRWRIPDGTLVRPSQFLHGNLFVLPNGTLHIRRVGPKDLGSYECTASNAVGADKRTVRVGTEAAATEKLSPSSSLFKDSTPTVPVHPSDRLSSSKFSPSSPSDRSKVLVSLIPNSSHSSSYQHSVSNSAPKINKTVTASPTHNTRNPSSLSPFSTVPTNNTKLSPAVNNSRVSSSSFPPSDRRVSAVLHPSPSSPFSKARIVSMSPSISSVHYGGSLHLHCSVTGNPTPVIIWRTPNRKLVDTHFSSFDRRLKVHLNGTLTVQAVTEKDAGDYLCIARNKIADDYRLLRVFVATKPAKIEPKQPPSQTVKLGKPLKVDCQASGLPDPAVRWSLPDGTVVNSVLHGEERGRLTRQLTVFDNGTLLVPAVGIKEEGEYTCYAENQGGQDTMKVKVRVMMTFPPSFTDDRSFHVVKVYQGATASIPCRVIGDPPLTVTWFSPAHRIIPQSVGSGLYSERVVVVSGRTLEVRMAQKTDTGNYTCRVSNSDGGRSMIVSLEVETATPGLSGQVGRQGFHNNRPGGFTIGVTSKPGIDNSHSIGHTDNNGRVRNVVPNSSINSAISVSTPALRSQNGFTRPVSGITTQQDTSVVRVGVSRAGTVGIKADNIRINGPGIVSSSNVVGNSQSTVRGVSVVRNPGTNINNNNEVVVGQAGNDARNTSGDPGSLTSISRNFGGISQSMSNKNGAGTNRGSGVSSNLEDTSHSRTNVAGSGTKNSTTMKQRAVIGQTVLLPCPSRGSPLPRLSWLLPGNSMLPAPYYGSRLTVHRNGSLELRGIRASDGGTLVCVVRGDREEMMIRVELEVLEGQEVAGSPKPERPVQKGVHHSRGLLDPTRSLSSRPVFPPVVLHPRVTQKVLPATSRPVGPSPSSPGRVSQPAVNARTAPLVSIINGETLRLPCPQTHGDTQGPLYWTMPSGKVLSRGESGDSGRFSVGEDGMLTVQRVSVFDRGTYTCRFTVYNTSSVTAFPVIIIAYPPRIISGPAPVTYTRPGVTVELPCFTIATPRATVTWETPDLAQLRVMDQARIYGNRYLNPQGLLVIQNPTSRDTGFYRCTANNVIGVDTKATYLHVI